MMVAALYLALHAALAIDLVCYTPQCTGVQVWFNKLAPGNGPQVCWGDAPLSQTHCTTYGPGTSGNVTACTPNQWDIDPDPCHETYVQGVRCRVDIYPPATGDTYIVATDSVVWDFPQNGTCPYPRP